MKIQLIAYWFFYVKFIDLKLYHLKLTFLTSIFRFVKLNKMHWNSAENGICLFMLRVNVQFVCERGKQIRSHFLVLHKWTIAQFQPCKMDLCYLRNSSKKNNFFISFLFVLLPMKWSKTSFVTLFLRMKRK